MNIADVMTPCPYTIDANASMNDALEKMRISNIRHLPVKKGDLLIGILSKRDVKLSKLICDHHIQCPNAGDIALKDPYIVQATDDAGQVAKEMADKKLDCVIVADSNGTLVGLFTTIDACNLIHLLLNERDI